MLKGKRFGRFEIQLKVGQGGMGQVYAAFDGELGRRVAIKLLPSDISDDPDRQRRFRHEARTISALNHPNIITIYEVGESEDGTFLATEYVDGTTLRELIRKGSLSLIEGLRFIEQASKALIAAHAAGIVHRDIKPENIMIRRDSIVKVLDFGLAKLNRPILGETAQTDRNTVPGTVMGSSQYMSPEQARGSDIDEPTDIWSLGVVLYEILSGRAPFSLETSADTLAAIIHNDPEPISVSLPNAPPELERILSKDLQKDREKRYQSMKDLSLDLKGLLFDIEHTDSGARPLHTVSSEFSESPTVINRTVSGNHPTDQDPAF